MTCSREILVVSILLSCSAAAFGQMPPGPPGMRPPAGGGPDFNRAPPDSLPLAMLAMQKSVQGELKLDKTQKQRLQELDAKLRKAMAQHMRPPGGRDMAGGPKPPDGGNMGGGSPPNDAERGDRPPPPDHRGMGNGPPPDGANAGNRPPPGGADRAAGPKPPGKDMEKAEKRLADILSGKQLARLKQIALQLEGPRALLAPERVKELDLTEKQQEKIRRLAGSAAKSATAVLTREQQAKWREAIGRPFRGTIAFPPPGGPMPRNGSGSGKDW